MKVWLLRNPLSFSRGRNKVALSLDLLLFFLSQELGIKHPLHRKKLQLALQALGSEEENNHGKLDYHWVTSKILVHAEAVALDRSL